MLTAATMVMPLGTDPANTRHASAERTDTTDISFAKSFDESSALAVGTPAQVAADRKPKDSTDLQKSVPGNDRESIAAVVDLKVKMNVSAKDEIQKESAGAKNPPALPRGNTTPPMAAGVTISSIAILPHGGTTETSSPAIEAEIPVGSLPSESEDLANTDRKNTASVVDTKVDATNAEVDFQADEGASVVEAISDAGIKPPIPNLQAKPVLDKNSGAVATEKGTKSHVGVVKAGKSAKAEEKKTPETVESTPGAELQTVVAALIAVAPADRAQPPLNTVIEGDALSSVSSSAVGHGIAAAVLRAGAHDKNTEVIKQTDDGTGKMASPALANDSVLQKTDVRDSKTSLSAIKSAGDDNVAARSAAEPLTAGGAAHAELRATGVDIGGAASSATAHVVAGGNIHATGSDPHAATMLSSTAIDSGAVVDVTHKTLMATPTSLEIGVANGTHGWLKIRADMTDGGVVNASLSTATSSGQEMLHRELPSLTAYLQNERVAVNTVVIQSPITPGTDFRGFDGGMTGDGRGQAQQSGSQGGENRQEGADSLPAQIEREGSYSGRNGIGRDELLSLTTRAGGGNWLNVRA